jgi:hypothetical protein
MPQHSFEKIDKQAISGAAYALFGPKKTSRCLTSALMGSNREI